MGCWPDATASRWHLGVFFPTRNHEGNKGAPGGGSSPAGQRYPCSPTVTPGRRR